MDIDLLVEDARWDSLPLNAMCEKAVARTLAHLDLALGTPCVSILACDDARIAVLNAEFRGKPLPTNVLSWPAADLQPDHAGASPGLPVPGPDDLTELGDIALSYDTCAREAADQGKTLPAHVSHLLVHGTLHLLGYDHETDADAALMEKCEREILGKMGIDDPYNE